MMIAPVIVKPANFHDSLRFGASFLKAFTGSDSESLPMAAKHRSILKNGRYFTTITKHYQRTKRFTFMDFWENKKSLSTVAIVL